ncbi:MAG: DMT family transporter [Candidatus Altiarchaeota archaeon]
MMSRRKAEVYVLATAFLWSLGGVFIKYLALPAPTIIFYRTVIGTIVLAFFVRRWRHPFSIAVPFSMLAYAGATMFYVWATTLTTAGAAVMLQFTSPVWVFILSYIFLKEKIQKRNLAPLALCMAGVYLFFTGELNPSHIKGNIVALASGVSFASLFITYRYLRDYDSAWLVLLGTATAGVLIFPFAHDKLVVETWQLALLIVMALVQLTLPYILFTKALKVIPTQEASLIGLIEPVINPIWVWIIVGETLSKNMILGGALILGALLFRFVREKETNIPNTLKAISS